MLADVPGPLPPAHGAGVQGGQQRRPRLGGFGLRMVIGQQDAGRAGQVDLSDVERVQRPPDLRGRPAGPSLQVGGQGRAEGGQPPA